MHDDVYCAHRAIPEGVRRRNVWGLVRGRLYVGSFDKFKG